MIGGPPKFDLSRIDEIENIWIPTRDGTLLAARLWLPKDAAPVPAILEYIPYRKRDLMRERDEPMHRFYALSGYASLRVDLRGSGDSQGILTDEYAPIELQDALDIIDWIAGQPWCDGGVGMTGISWGGFNALQVAALRPPALKAVISLCASDDRYSDDAHFKGGCLMNENLQWGSILTLYNALPPDPVIVGDAWREMWQARLDALDLFPAKWMAHPLRDAYWRQGSVCEDYAAISCAVYAIGGWADGYSNAVPRLMAGLSCPRKGLIGPWGHAYPHLAVPGPNIGYLQEAVRWWDHWLKGADTGIMVEPMLRTWIQDPVPPQPQHRIRPGRWVAEDCWPSPNIKPLEFHLHPGRLKPEPGPAGIQTLSSPQTLGLRAGEWCGFGSDGEAAGDQRTDDGGSLIFDSDRFEEPCDLLGAPVIELEAMSDRLAALIVARLCDIAPDGASSLISYGMLNLTHRARHARADPLVPGNWMPVNLQLDDLGHRIVPGHRIRLALSTTYWPMLWPSPEPVLLSVRVGTARLTLPQRPYTDKDDTLPPFEAPIAAPGITYRNIEPLEMHRSVAIDLTTNEMVHTLTSDGGEFGGAALAALDEIDLELSYHQTKRFRIIEGDPLSAQAAYNQTAMLRREDWQVHLACDISLTATSDEFHVTCRFVAHDGDEIALQREWSVPVPRGLL